MCKLYRHENITVVGVACLLRYHVQKLQLIHSQLAVQELFLPGRNCISLVHYNRA